MISRLKQIARAIGLGLAKLTAIIFSLVTLAILLMLLDEAGQAAQSNTWQPTNATVIQMSGVQRARTRHYLNTTYEYTADGQTYQAERVHFFEMFGFIPYDELQAISEAYPRGSRVPIFYNPSQPQQAVMMRDLNGGDWLVFFVTLVCIILPGMAMTGLPGFFVVRDWLHRLGKEKAPAISG